MAHRRRRRRSKKSSADETILLAIVGLSVLVGVVSGAVAFLKQYGVWIAAGGAVLLGLAIVGAFTVAYRQKRERDRRYSIYNQIEHFLSMHPQEFEKFVGWVFEKQGYKVTVTQYRGDHGLDVVLAKDGKRYAVQVKRYGRNNHVGEPEVRDFHGSCTATGAVKGFFVTTSSFTPAAKKWAYALPIVLIDGERLVEMVQEIKSESMVEIEKPASLPVA